MAVHIDRPVKAASRGQAAADELHKLAALHREGILTDEEFQLAKAQILKR
jgi:hypothetical protein